MSQNLEFEIGKIVISSASSNFWVPEFRAKKAKITNIKFDRFARQTHLTVKWLADKEMKEKFSLYVNEEHTYDIYESYNRGRFLSLIDIDLKCRKNNA
jgi:hypothetical protein